MKKIVFLTIMATSILASANPTVSRVPASKSELKIECSVPKNFAGFSATLKGKLKLTPLPNGASQGKGKLTVSLLKPALYWSGTKQAAGQYDDLSSVNSDRYFHGGLAIKNADDIMMVYINFSRPEMSYVEYEEVNYKTECKEQ